MLTIIFQVHLANQVNQAKMVSPALLELLVTLVAQAPLDHKANLALLDILVAQDQLDL